MGISGMSGGIHFHASAAIVMFAPGSNADTLVLPLAVFCDADINLTSHPDHHCASATFR
jgi:hypothetical protein